VARDRKRAKQRRERQARSGAAQARPRKGGLAPARDPESHEHEAPELASGEVDLADAQLALGRPELVDANGGAPDATAPDVADEREELPELADEAGFEQLEDEVDEAEAVFEDGADGPANGGAAGAEVARRRQERLATAPRQEGNRFANFLRGSWRELQRVQWPDRRQVAQATAVVIGFLIVAGAFLGLMDLLASKIVNLII
jgi:preprotein translocase subunit SecE